MHCEVRAAWRVVLNELWHGGAHSQEQGSSAGSGLASWARQQAMRWAARRAMREIGKGFGPQLE
jgi:hypothetical protein